MASVAVTAVTITRFTGLHSLAVVRTLPQPTLERAAGWRAFLPGFTMFPDDPRHAAQPAEGHGSLLVLALLALVVGAAAGLVGAIFRLTLEQADRLRDALIAWA